MTFCTLWTRICRQHQRRLGFSCRSVHVVEKLEMGQVSFRILPSSSLSVIRRTLHTNLTFKASLLRQAKGEAFGPSNQSDVIIFFNGKHLNEIHYKYLSCLQRSNHSDVKLFIT